MLVRGAPGGSAGQRGRGGDDPGQSGRDGGRQHVVAQDVTELLGEYAAQFGLIQHTQQALGAAQRGRARAAPSRERVGLAGRRQVQPRHRQPRGHAQLTDYQVELRVLYLADRPGPDGRQGQPAAACPPHHDQDRGDRDPSHRTAATGDTHPDQPTPGQDDQDRGGQACSGPGQFGCPQGQTAHSHPPPSDRAQAAGRRKLQPLPRQVRPGPGEYHRTVACSFQGQRSIAGLFRRKICPS